MDLYLFSRPSEKTFTLQLNESIKLINYCEDTVIFVNNNNEIFKYNSKDDDLEGIIFKKEENNLQFKNITHLSCSYSTIIIVDNYKEIYTKELYFGYDNGGDPHYKQINTKVLDYNEKIKFIRSGNNFFFVVTTNNLIYGYGYNSDGTLGMSKNVTNVTTLTKIETDIPLKDLQCSQHHSILLDTNGNIYTTGFGGWGALGLTDKLRNRYRFEKVDLPFKVIKIFADNAVSFIVNEFNEIYGTGANFLGTLGLGYEDEVTEFTKTKIDGCEDPKSLNNYFSYNESSFFTDNNDIYLCGGDDRFVNYLGFNFEENFNLNKFVKLNISKITKRNYIKVFPMTRTTLIISSDYLVGSEDGINENNNELGLKCLQTIGELHDIKINCNY